MFEELERRGREAAEARAGERREAIAARAAGIRGVQVEVSGERILLSGRGLMGRRLTEAELRWLGRGS